MKHKRLIAFSLGSAVLALGVASVAVSDDEGKSRWPFSGARADFPQVTNELYKAECGSCHMAYQPGLLPARSWVGMMNQLERHFGENAELSRQDRDSLTLYLVENAADTVGGRRSQKINRSIAAAATPLRISEIPYIISKHDEIPARALRGNPKVGSLSNCNACHQGAEKGSYEEHEVLIPGYGRWED